MSRPRKSKPREHKQVALAIVAHEYAYGREKIKGVIDYYSKHSAWEIRRNELSQPFVATKDLAGRDGDGVIGEIYTAEDVAMVAGLPMPFINTSSSDLAADFPSVSVDNHAIGHMAAVHLLGCRLDSFAFVGPAGLCHVQKRFEGFSQGVEKAGGKCRRVEYVSGLAHATDISEEMVNHEELLDALGGLCLPAGIMASSDRVGFAVLEACRLLGLRSPEDVALIGVDNDEIFCNLAHSSMTSIDPNARRVGFEAAAMLDKLMDGVEPESRHVLIPPLRIVFRNSTDMARSQFPEVARALRFIRNHAHEFIDVTNVLDVVPVSRRWLEMKFKEEVGRGIYQEIRHLHVERAKELLQTTGWPVSRIAKESGFSSSERMEFAFSKLVGMSASQYRKQQIKKRRNQAAHHNK
jgi:LacI family transcriptional regulator